MKRLLLFYVALSYAMGTYLSAQNLVRVQDERTGLYGYKYENSDKWVVKPKYYEAAREFHDGLAYVIRENGYYKDKRGRILTGRKEAGYINEKGKLCIPLKFYWAYNFVDGIALVKIWDSKSLTGWKFGFIDTSGKYVIPPIYDYAESFDYSGTAKVKWYKNGVMYSSRVKRNGEHGAVESERVNY